MDKRTAERLPCKKQYGTHKEQLLQSAGGCAGKKEKACGIRRNKPRHTGLIKAASARCYDAYMSLPLCRLSAPHKSADRKKMAAGISRKAKAQAETAGAVSVLAGCRTAGAAL